MSQLAFSGRFYLEALILRHQAFRSELQKRIITNMLPARTVVSNHDTICEYAKWRLP